MTRRVKALRTLPTDSPRVREMLRSGNDFMFLDPGLGPQYKSDPPPDRVELLRETWQVLRGELTAEYAREHVACRCWGWWAFDAPEQRGRDETEWDFLQRHGLLTDNEAAAVRLGLACQCWHHEIPVTKC